MKKTILLTGVLFALSVMGFTQTQKQQSGTIAGSSDAKVIVESGTRIDGQLQNAVDVKKSRVGDQVVLKTTRSITQNGRTVIPKGSRLIGRITEVQQRSKSGGASRLGMVFDRLEGKDLDVPISASILSITNAAVTNRVDDTSDTGVFASSTTQSSSTARTSSGGGLLGGVTSTVGGVTGTTTGVLNTTTQTVGGVTSSAGQTIGTTTGSLGKTVGGISISNSASGSAQTGTTLSSPGRDIRLEKGVTMQLQLDGSVKAQ